MEENIFPSPLSCNSARELEEERRLLYVAITRAERHCILTCAKNRWRYGKLEFDTPSRFLRDIDPRLMIIESESQSDETIVSRNFSFHNSRMQNSRPVGTQFRADPKPKITSPRQPETPVDPFSDSFKRRLAASGGNLRRVSDVIRSGNRAPVSPASNENPTQNNGSQLAEGSIIEHQRFGIGKVIKIEGTGENTKATVEFKNSGTKQLLLKFARFTVIG